VRKGVAGDTSNGTLSDICEYGVTQLGEQRRKDAGETVFDNKASAQDVSCTCIGAIHTSDNRCPSDGPCRLGRAQLVDRNIQCVDNGLEVEWHLDVEELATD
jgi:hypothetical protein